MMKENVWPPGTHFRWMIVGSILVAWLLSRATSRETRLYEIERQSDRMSRSLHSLVFGYLWRKVNAVVPWHKVSSFLPFISKYLAVANLWALRSDLREKNLYETGEPRYDTSNFRQPDGYGTDHDERQMGKAGTAFARNFPASECVARQTGADPAQISRDLLKRKYEINPETDTKSYERATSLNLWAAAWIQFMVHGWFDHVPHDTREFEIPLADGGVSRIKDDKVVQSGAHTMRFNSETHWWDGSQIYGSSLERQKELRSYIDGQLRLDDYRMLPGSQSSPAGELTGFSNNWWMGLSLLHTMFAREHNDICTYLRCHESPPARSKRSSWDDHTLFNTARLINAAVMAKIHTVEWTPGILGHPALDVSMKGNWWGLVTRHLKPYLKDFSDSEAIRGIIGSPVDHHSAPFALTEEFVAVYRLHTLIPDEVEFLNAASNKPLCSPLEFTHVQGGHTRQVMESLMSQPGNLTDLAYSFGMQSPGAITLNNYPDALRNFQKPDGTKLDLAALDVIRDRRRGIPTYNRFRELLRMPRAATYDDISSQWSDNLKGVYGTSQSGQDNVDDVDAMIGMLAEDKPAGFGFGDTAFRIFILLASRRLKSDRFFTDDYSASVYTNAGLEWIEKTDFKTVLKRQCGDLGSGFEGKSNTFQPWNS